MSNQAAADMVAECERLARDFGRLALADVLGSIVTERRLTWSRRPGVRVDDCPRFLRKQPAVAPGFLSGGSNGVELGDVIPQTAEDWQAAPMWYVPRTGEPVVNSAGQSIVIESGWKTIHEHELSGAHATHAVELLKRAGVWTANRWGWLSRLLWPGRDSVVTDYCWPDVVNRVSELANDATLPKPKWSVVIGPHHALVDVEIWRRWNDPEFGGFLNVSPEDIERIGEVPEVVYGERLHWLKDSETALEWLARRLQPVALDEPAIPKPSSAKRGPKPKAESQLLRTSLLAHMREHPSLIDDPAKLARLVGDVNVRTVRRWIDEERERYLSNKKTDDD